jgi:HEAT repeat protein
MVLTDRFFTQPDIGEMTGKKDIPGLIRLLSSRHHEIHAAAIAALGRIGPDATPFLITALKRKSRILRLGVIGALAEIQDSRSLSALVDRTKDDSSEIRWQAAIALGELGDPMAAPALLDALRDKDKYVRYASAISLMKTGYHLVTDEDWSWYYAGMQQWDKLVSLGKSALPTLINLMRDPDSEVRRNAVHTMGEIGNRDAGSVLVKALGDEDRQVRWEAVMASEKCGVPPMQLPRGLCARPRTRKNPLVAGFLNFLLPGLGYGYLGKWWGIMIFQIDITVTVWLFKTTGEADTYSILFPFYLFLAVHAWYITKMMPEDAP